MVKSVSKPTLFLVTACAAGLVYLVAFAPLPSAALKLPLLAVTAALAVRLVAAFNWSAADALVGAHAISAGIWLCGVILPLDTGRLVPALGLLLHTLGAAIVWLGIPPRRWLITVSGMAAAHGLWAVVLCYLAGNAAWPWWLAPILAAVAAAQIYRLRIQEGDPAGVFWPQATAATCAGIGLAMGLFWAEPWYTRPASERWILAYLAEAATKGQTIDPQAFARAWQNEDHKVEDWVFNDVGGVGDQEVFLVVDDPKAISAWNAWRATEHPGRIFLRPLVTQGTVEQALTALAKGFAAGSKVDEVVVALTSPRAAEILVNEDQRRAFAILRGARMRLFETGVTLGTGFAARPLNQAVSDRKPAKNPAE